MKNSGKQLVGILVLFAIVLVVFFCVSNGGNGGNGGNGTSSSNFGALTRYTLTNKTKSNLNIAWIINNGSLYGASDNGSGAQKIVEIKVYSADGLDYYHFYYGGSYAWPISKDPKEPTIIRLNGTGGKLRGSYYYDIYGQGTIFQNIVAQPGGISGRYVRIFRSTKRDIYPPYALALLIYVDGYGNLIDYNDKVSENRGLYGNSTSRCGNCMPLDPGTYTTPIGLVSIDVPAYSLGGSMTTICPFVSLPTQQSIPIINNIKEYRKVSSIHGLASGYNFFNPKTNTTSNTIPVDNTKNIEITT
jgi:preprotein translocase subunit SecG